MPFKPRLNHEQYIERVVSLSTKPPDGPGLSKAKIALELGISERQVGYLRAEAKERKVRVHVVPLPRPQADLLPLHLWMLQPTVDSFERFYTTFSGTYFPGHWRAWVAEYLANDRLLVNVPPRHAKSTLFSCWIPVWEICRNRDVQIIIVSKTSDQAKKWARSIERRLTRIPSLIEAYGTFKPENADEAPWRPQSGELMVAGRQRESQPDDFTVQVRGSGQEILGSEADIIIGDDPTNAEISASPAERKKHSEWWRGEVMTRLSPTSRTVVVGQRVHLLDLYGELIKQRLEDNVPVWTHINFPAVNFQTKEVLWPEEWTYERLMKTRSDIGPVIFDTMYQQNPLPEGAAKFKRAWLLGEDGHPGCLDRDRIIGQRAPLPWIELPDGTKDTRQTVRVVSLDPSPTEQAGLIVADVLVSRDAFFCGIIECTREQMDVKRMLDHLERTAQYLPKPEYFLFEWNATQRWFAQDPRFQEWQRKTGIHLSPHTTGRNKGNEDYGIQSLAREFESGSIRLPYGDAEARRATDKFLDEALVYDMGEYDDLLMALWFIRFNFNRLTPVRHGIQMRQGGMGFDNPFDDGWGAWAPAA